MFGLERRICFSRIPFFFLFPALFFHVSLTDLTIYVCECCPWVSWIPREFMSNLIISWAGMWEGRQGWGRGTVYVCDAFLRAFSRGPASREVLGYLHRTLTLIRLWAMQ